MICELSITDFAIIDSLRVELERGFIVFTGETGAGKSIMIDAVELLLGGRADATMVRSGASVARVEAVCSLDGDALAAIKPILAREELLDDDTVELTIAREIRSEGRSICRINGRVVSLGLMSEIGNLIADVHGQSEHLSLLRAREHLFLLDRFANIDEQREALANKVSELQSVRSDLDSLRRSESEIAQRIDLLRFQLDEIQAANLTPGEEAALTEERVRLANAEKLAHLAEEAIVSLSEGGDDAMSAMDLFGRATHALAGLSAIDSSLETMSGFARTLGDQLNELVRDLRSYRDQIEFNPRRLEEVDDRLHLLRRLQRKYGATIDGILDHALKAETELNNLSHSEERIEELQKQENELLHEIGRLGNALTMARRKAASKMQKSIEAELDELHMSGTKFRVQIESETDPDGAYVEDSRIAFDSTGLDRIEFLIAPNAGETLRPLVKIASGGETSRLMLALKSVLAKADPTPALIFDEIDQGIGGRVGTVIGRKLWNLSHSHQVLCITHLPQLAAYGDQHFKVEKEVAGKRTVTRVRAMDSSERIAELAQMLGMETDKTRKSAREILQTAAAEKTLNKSQ